MAEPDRTRLMLPHLATVPVGHPHSVLGHQGGAQPACTALGPQGAIFCATVFLRPSTRAGARPPLAVDTRARDVQPFTEIRYCQAAIHHYSKSNFGGQHVQAWSGVQQELTP